MPFLHLNFFSSNLLVENKYKQHILHVTLKAGYYNKLVVHGEAREASHLKIIDLLLSSKNSMVQSQMKCIINR